MTLEKESPSGWESVRLDEVCEFLDSKRIPVSEKERNSRIKGKKDDSLYPYLGVNGPVGLIDDYIFDEPTIILAEDGGNFGSKDKPISYIAQGKYWVNNHAHVLRPKKNILLKFLHYSLRIRTDIMRYVIGSTRLKLNQSSAKKIPIKLPPLEVQERIVEILDKAERLKELREETIKKSEELKHSIFNSEYIKKSEKQLPTMNHSNMWKETSLESVTDKIGDGLHGTPNYNPNGEYYFINGNNLNDGKISSDNKTKKVTLEEYYKFKKQLSDRTLFISINGTLGNFAYYNNEKIILGKSACYLNIKKHINKYFIGYILNSNYFRKYLESSATVTTIKNVSLKSIRDYKFYMPPLDVQERIVEILDKAERIKELHKESNKELTSSLLQKAFKGEL